MVNGTYYPDATFLGFHLWKHETRDIWLRAGSPEDWCIVDSPTGSVPYGYDGKTEKTRYYHSEEIHDEDENLRNPWEVGWSIDADGLHPAPKVRISNPS